MTEAEHNRIDTTTLDSPDYTYLCAGCGPPKTEPKTHWPLYPYTQPITTDRGIGTTTFKVYYNIGPQR